MAAIIDTEKSEELPGHSKHNRPDVPRPDLDTNVLTERRGHRNDRYLSANDPKQVVFKEGVTMDGKDALKSKHKDASTARTMAQAADERGWDSVKVKGSEEYRREAWLEASARGMDVKGYKPREQDLNALEQRKAQYEQQAAAASRDEPQAATSEASGSEQARASEQNAEAERAQAIHSAASKLGERLPTREDKERLQAAINDRMDRQQQQGESLPDVRGQRATVGREQERAAEARQSAEAER